MPAVTVLQRDCCYEPTNRNAASSERRAEALFQGSENHSVLFSPRVKANGPVNVLVAQPIRSLIWFLQTCLSDWDLGLRWQVLVVLLHRIPPRFSGAGLLKSSFYSTFRSRRESGRGDFEHMVQRHLLKRLLKLGLMKLIRWLASNKWISLCFSVPFVHKYPKQQMFSCLDLFCYITRPLQWNPFRESVRVDVSRFTHVR